MKILDKNRIRNAKRAFSTRRVPICAMRTLLLPDRTPKVGDLVLARVTTLGSHKRIELPTGRKAQLFPGDEVTLAYGNRYAPDQYEAYVPDALEPCHMVAAGGLAATATAWHDRLAGPTEIEPVGLIGDVEHEPLNLADYAIAPRPARPLPPVFAVFGTSMNAGKTTTAASLVKGFSLAGYKVGAAKITGTGAGGDLWLMRDSGAAMALDFTDAGHPSTFGISLKALMAIASTLTQALVSEGCSVIVLEIADGLYQEETAALARSTPFTGMLSGTFFAANDAMGAVSGAAHLTGNGHTVMGITGAMTRSPLAKRETAAASPVPVLSIEELTNPGFITHWTGLDAQRYAAAS